LRTAESGYLTRRLVDPSQELIVRENDCGTVEYILISREEAKIRGEEFGDLILGRVLAADVEDAHGNVILKTDDMISKTHRDLIINGDVDFVKVKSAITCRTISGVCQKCFGMDLSTRELVDIGIPVGVISSQSIGEPGTQLTMRTFHS
jgi:DNA-directed RNA polymerase subunit beta'